MQFHAPSVSISAEGDYFQLFLGPSALEEDETDQYEVKGPYLLVQRQFETPDGGRCYIEALNEEFIGHFLLRLTELSRTHLAFEIARKSHTQVDISFELNAAEFEEVRGVAEVIFGLREPEYGDDDKAH